MAEGFGQGFAKRLARVADGLGQEAKTCAILDRTIQDNVHLLRYTLGEGEAEAHFDQAKAFDRVDHLYLVSVPTQFAVVLGFLKLILTIYNIDSVVQMQGFMSKPLCITRSFCQASPLSPLLMALSYYCGS